MVSFATILVRPERPANVGAAARALKNFGFSDLRIVGPCEALPGGTGFSEARALAWNAGDVLETARSHPTIGDAVANLRLVAAASAKPGFRSEILTPREFATEVSRLPAGAAAGCVFGPEDHGLSNEELDACRVRVRIPTASAQPSLNLAQAVMVIAYEVGLALAIAPPTCEPSGDSLPALEGDVQRLSDAFRALALEAGYLNGQAPEHVQGELRRLLSRARPTQREVLLLLGLASQLHWAQRNVASLSRQGTTMTCSHVRPDESLGLPCAWPGCPEGTEKESVAVMRGASGVLTKSMPGPKFEIAAEEGVTLYRRRQTTDGWEWVQP